jgi:hypothetical protein
LALLGCFRGGKKFEDSAAVDAVCGLRLLAHNHLESCHTKDSDMLSPLLLLLLLLAAACRTPLARWMR